MIEKINKILEKLPPEYREPIREIVEVIIQEQIEENRRLIIDEFSKVWNAIENMRKSNEEEFKRIWSAIQELKDAIKQSNERIDKLEETMRKEFNRVWQSISELTEAIKESNKRIDRLEEATREEFNKVWQVIKELSDSIKEMKKIYDEQFNRVWNAIDRLEKAIDEMRKSYDEQFKEVRHSIDRFERKINALGARWGISSEGAFREGIAFILKDLGIKVERIAFYDEEGYVFNHPSEIELDLVIYDSKTIAIEIKSSVNKGDVGLFDKKVKLFEKKFNRKVDKKIIISPFVDPRGTIELAKNLNIQIFENPENFVL